MTVTKQDLTDRLYETLGLSKVEAKIIVDLFFDTIRKTLARGEEVKLSGFGNFTLRDKRPRPGRNPKTGVATEISARRVVTFHASQILKDHCLGG
ncbi:integration host factor subunit alpha [Acidithiobacillus ferriphilus]|uniref:integration host factor subunit alpha n=1 Tax=Acidithiobacillus ferriphilus TaxID=1689834 RepID=UPI003F517952